MGAIRSDWYRSAHHNRVHVRDSAVPHACLTPYAPGGIPNRYMPPRAPCAAGRVRKLASQLSRTTIDSYARLATCAICRDHHHHASTDITQMVVTCEHVITYTPWCSPWWPRVASPPAVMRLRGPWMKTRTVALCRERPRSLRTRHAYAMPTPCLRAQSRQCTCA